MSRSLDLAIESVRETLRPDGVDIEFQREEEGVAHFRLVLDDVECQECVVPSEILEQILLNSIRKNVPEISAVKISDPRTQAPT